MDVEVLSRIQFAMTISFHFLFPPMTIGLGLMLVVMQFLRVRTGKQLYLDMAQYWTKVFGLIFAIGVATGIPMEFQFGMNWAHYARFVGDIFGSPLAIEGIYAFFLESGFLALLLFGWNKVGPKMHLFSTCMVALGAHFSAIWILVANSWMQTPAGYHLARQVKVTDDGFEHLMTANLGTRPFTLKEIPVPEGYVVQPGDLGHVRAVIDDFSAAIFNPSTMDRLAHTVFGCWMTGAFLVAGVSAWWLLRGRHVEQAKASLKISLVVALVASCLQGLAADSTARGVARNQPLKLAAIEGLQKTTKDAPLAVVGIVTWKRGPEGKIVGVEEKAIKVPYLLSILVSGDFLHPLKAAEKEVKGLEDLPSNEFLRSRHPSATDEELARIRPSYWPNVPVVFQTYHVMISVGSALMGLSVLCTLLWATGRLWRTDSRPIRLILFALVAAPVLCHVCMQAGWFTAEMGRQPWIVYQVLKTGEANSAVVKAPQVFRSILMFAFIYLVLSYLFGMLFIRLVKRGPVHAGHDDGLPEKWEPLSLRDNRETERA